MDLMPRRRSVRPLPGEFGVAVRCVAPTRSSLIQANSLLFPFNAFNVCSIGHYYMRAAERKSTRFSSGPFDAHAQVPNPASSVD